MAAFHRKVQYILCLANKFDILLALCSFFFVIIVVHSLIQCTTEDNGADFQHNNHHLPRGQCMGKSQSMMLIKLYVNT